MYMTYIYHFYTQIVDPLSTYCYYEWQHLAGGLIVCLNTHLPHKYIHIMTFTAAAEHKLWISTSPPAVTHTRTPAGLLMHTHTFLSCLSTYTIRLFLSLSITFHLFLPSFVRSFLHFSPFPSTVTLFSLYYRRAAS